jgi:hypothetical protein
LPPKGNVNVAASVWWGCHEMFFIVEIIGSPSPTSTGLFIVRVYEIKVELFTINSALFDGKWFKICHVVNRRQYALAIIRTMNAVDDDDDDD